MARGGATGVVTGRLEALNTTALYDQVVSHYNQAVRDYIQVTTTWYQAQQSANSGLFGSTDEQREMAQGLAQLRNSITRANQSRTVLCNTLRNAGTIGINTSGAVDLQRRVRLSAEVLASHASELQETQEVFNDLLSLYLEQRTTQPHWSTGLTNQAPYSFYDSPVASPGRSSRMRSRR